MNFPDKNYLEELTLSFENRLKKEQTVEDRLLMYSGGLLNWVGDFMSDPKVTWQRQTLNLDSLTLTGTKPAWNEVVLGRAERSPKRFRELIHTEQGIIKLFTGVVFDPRPILVREDKGVLKVLDGMHRVLAALLEDRENIEGYVATLRSHPKPCVEPHVVYDLLRAYVRDLNRDSEGLARSLTFLQKAYGNVDSLLRERFNYTWVPDEEVQAIIAGVLKE